MLTSNTSGKAGTTDIDAQETSKVQCKAGKGKARKRKGRIINLCKLHSIPSSKRDKASIFSKISPASSQH
jgi:hypothetical protein